MSEAVTVPRADESLPKIIDFDEISVQRSTSTSSISWNELTGDIEFDFASDKGRVPRGPREAEEDKKSSKGQSRVSLSSTTTPSSHAPSAPDLQRAPTNIFSTRIDQVHPMWRIMLVGGYLCLSMGWVNAVAFRGFDGGITHMTGTATSVGLNLAKGQILLHLRASAKLLSFFLGAAFSSAYLGTNSSLKSDPKYAHLLMLVSFSMYAAFLAESAAWPFSGELLLASGSGAQNALTTIYSGAVLRSTHVTGTLTDMGIELGKIIFHGDNSGRWKLELLTTFLICYVLGGFFGALCFNPDEIQGVDFVGAEAKALLVPATGTLALAAGWWISRSRLSMSGLRGKQNQSAEFTDAAASSV